MTIAIHTPTTFFDGYARLLTACWTDDAFSSLLAEDPVDAMGRVGLRVERGVTISVVRQAEGVPAPTMFEQAERWERSKATGVFEILVPDAPVITEDEIMESELESTFGPQSLCSCCSCCG